MKFISSLLPLALLAAAAPVEVSNAPEPYALRVISNSPELNGRFLHMNNKSMIGLFQPANATVEPYRVLKLAGSVEDTFALRHYPSGLPNSFLALVGREGIPEVKNQEDPNNAPTGDQLMLWREWAITKENWLRYNDGQPSAWGLFGDGVLRKYNGIVPLDADYIEIDVEVVPYPDSS